MRSVCYSPLACALEQGNHCFCSPYGLETPRCGQDWVQKVVVAPNKSTKIAVMAGYGVNFSFTFMKTAVFWNVMPYGFISVCRITRRHVVFVVTKTITSNLSQ
jgi:hypothetical protein